MVASGAVAVFIGFLPQGDKELIAPLMVIWGIAAVADSAQFSTAISELADPRYLGLALSLQTALGFALIIISIRLLPIVQDAAGWGVAFAMLAAGPALGTLAMIWLRSLPEARRIAGGARWRALDDDVLAVLAEDPAHAIHDLPHGGPRVDRI